MLMLITLEYIPNINQFWEMLKERPVAFDETLMHVPNEPIVRSCIPN